jgi:hypothetical protein
VGDGGVGLEDAVEAAELGRHVGDGEAHVRREVAGGVADVLDRALHGHGVATQGPQRLEDDVLAAETEGQRAAVLDGDGLGDLDPALAQHHRHRDVRPAEADGEGAEPAVAAGVAVGAENDLAGLHEIPVEPGVQNGLVGVVEVLDAALAGEVTAEIGELLRALVGGERDGIDRVIDREIEAVFVVHRGLAQGGPGLVHAVPGQLGGDGPVDLDAHDVAGAQAVAGRLDGVRVEDLLRQRHRQVLGQRGAPWAVDVGRNDAPV